MRHNLSIVPMILAAMAASCSSSDGPLPQAGSTEPVAQPESVAQTASALTVGDELGLTAVTTANPKSPGLTTPDNLSPELAQIVTVKGSNPVENPATVTLADGTTVTLPYYGYDGDGTLLPLPGDLPSATHKVEASKTEPDKNTYLVLRGQHGADAKYQYGNHFLYQGHETGQAGYITRVNLDADAAHKVTVLASTDVSGQPLPTFDGSTWDPFAQRLLFSFEAGASGGIWSATLDFPSQVTSLFGSLGRAGYEGIQNDSDGNLWLVEDSGGTAGVVNTKAKQPNSFVYRFVPKNPADLTKGQLQALQVISLRTGNPIAFHAGLADADILSDDVKDVHTYGNVFTTHWVTIHDTEVDGTDSFSANALAKAKSATPFKRPENGQFRPGWRFTQFFFDETGDTNALSQANGAYGGWGSVLKLEQTAPSANDGKLSLVYLSDKEHSGFDNVAFWSDKHIVFVEDAGDTLHTQRNALDSAFILDVTKSYADTANQPLRLLAQGRDPSATIDSSFLGVTGLVGFQNEGDNEITGFHISNGDPTVRGILGAQVPAAGYHGWRIFYTGQHGDNVTWELVRKAGPSARGSFSGDLSFYPSLDQ